MEIFTASLLGSEEVHGRLCGGAESQRPDSFRRPAGTAGQVLPQAAHGGDPILPLAQSPSQVGTVRDRGGYAEVPFKQFGSLQGCTICLFFVTLKTTDGVL
jgi:hypothetical protein